MKATSGYERKRELQWLSNRLCMQRTENMVDMKA